MKSEKFKNPAKLIEIWYPKILQGQIHTSLALLLIPVFSFITVAEVGADLHYS